MNFMYLYLPVALTSINILIPVGLGLAVGLLSGLFGVGGGFLMTPLLIMFGIPSTVAAATDSNQIVAASTSGTYAHWKVGNVDFKMGLYLLIGGFLMVPVMVYILRMPMHVVVGTSLFQILFNCIEVTFLQAYTNHSVDFILAVLLLLGSTVGAQIGAVFGRKLKGEQLKIILATIVLAVTVKIVFDLTLTPSLLISQAGGH